jgi:hypothetical protein
VAGAEKHTQKHTFLGMFFELGGYQNSLKLFRPDLDRNKLGLNLV